MRWLLLSAVFVVAAAWSTMTPVAAADPLNVLIITMDDMSADSVGAFGCPLADGTPHMDRLAAMGRRFAMAHVQVGNCMPSRNVMWSGMYPHNNGVEGFYQVRSAKHAHLCDVMNDAGYFTAIRGKVPHSTPYSPYSWDLVLDVDASGRQRHPKDPASYGESMQAALDAASAAQQPFCIVMNVSDPHKPFYAEGKTGETIPDAHVPSRTYTPDDVPVPGFLFDDPVVRKELSHYYSSVRRGDDCVGEILSRLQASGLQDRTLIVFLSDHGMPLPFAKTQLYHHSTHTPLVVIWPGVTEPGSVDRRHMVSAVDLLPTLVEITGVKHPGTMDGRSFAATLRGEEQADRDFVVKEYNENSGGSRDPMRAIQTRQMLYIFNPWSDGKRVMATATTGTPTFRRLNQLANSGGELAARLDVYQHRTVEELYDVEHDPDCLVNLIDSAAHQAERKALCDQLTAWMTKTGDPLLPIFEQRDQPAVLAAYVQAQQAEADARKAGGKKGAAKKGTRKKQPANKDD